MPTFVITAPDGKKYRIKGEGTKEEALAAFQQQFSAREDNVPEQSYGAGLVDSITSGLTFGLGPKISAAEAALRGLSEGDTFKERYANALATERAQNERFRDENPVSAFAGEVGGGLVTGMGAANAGGRLAARYAPQAVTNSFLGKMAGDAALGAGIGTMQAYGADQNLGGGALLGGLLGAAARPVVAGVSEAGKFAGGLLGIGNKGRAQEAVYNALQRSGRSADDVVDDITRAGRDGQAEYATVDALGYPGQRMLTGIARMPGDARTRIHETLMNRQMGQGERLGNAIAEGFDAGQTAAARRSAMKSAREQTANALYPAARQNAGAVDVSGVIQSIDDIIRPGVQQLPSAGDDIAGDSIESALRGFRARLTDGKATVSDFNRLALLRQDVAAASRKAYKDGADYKGSILKGIRDKLDEALEGASTGYKAANARYASDSRAIDAIDEGMAAAGVRSRASDNIARFQQMTPEQQAAFRGGYAEPYLASLEGRATGVMTNKARPLMSPKTSREFPAFAAPGKGGQLQDRIAREQTMFETGAQAFGNSRTADNLADMAEIGQIDPSVVGSLLRGDMKGAAIQGVTKALQNLQGRNQQTRDMIADMLLERAPNKVSKNLVEAIRRGEKLTKTQQQWVAYLIGGTSGAYGAAN